MPSNSIALTNLVAQLGIVGRTRNTTVTALYSLPHLCGARTAHMSPKNEPNDLNAYELQRLENIRRNEEFLKTLGLSNLQQEVKPEVQPVKKNASSDLKERKRKVSSLTSSSSQAKADSSDPRTPPRRSSRVRGLPLDSVGAEPIHVEHKLRGYSDMPFVRKYSVHAIHYAQLFIGSYTRLILTCRNQIILMTTNLKCSSF